MGTGRSDVKLSKNKVSCQSPELFLSILLCDEWFEVFFCTCKHVANIQTVKDIGTIFALSA